MQDENVNHASSLLSSMLLTDRRLPDYLFKKKFDQYLFFDVDITSVDELIKAIKDVVINRITSMPDMAVFSFTEKAFVTWMGRDEDWVLKINEVYKLLRDKKDYNGLVLADASMKCIVHQPDPVSMGVFAFSRENGRDESWRNISDNVNGCFFDLTDVRGWLAGGSERDSSLIESMGREYLEALIENYD
ncbi:hypothetical protein [Dyella sp. GSA-30]|uniref:hypothetical protein n=1 Tax=Dyella sp. GSA-30 TaxID=2994496 RepID=UPI00249087F8|nr:hypothetical protein [Dyella sp. GSA-30]BDU19989.1 hypothetical protein DYGSA30_14460 [Dyella sp. GSA-30]